MRFSLVLGICLTIMGLALACTGPDRQFAEASGGGGSAPSGSSGTSVGGGSMGIQKCSHPSDCGTGVCSDGFCCDRDCSDQCEACDVSGSEGKCTFVEGTPHAPREVCNGSSTCAGVCDGTSQSCVFPSTTAICGASCDGTCDGKGTCSSKTPGSCPNGFACGTSGCLTKCVKPSDCQQFFTCSSGACKRIPESDCLDGVDNNGDGLADCDDPSCASQVECVEVPPSGELGEHITSGNCPANYDTSEEPFHTGLNPQPCVGCSCATNCSTTYHMHTAGSCAGAPLNYIVEGPPNILSSFVGCVDITNQTYLSATLDNATIGNCVGSGSASQADPTWTTNDTFCVAKTSSTCADGAHVCVAKRASAPLCARLDPANSCPTGYKASDTTMFTDFTQGSCGGCGSCTSANALTCTNFALGDQALTGASCSGGGTPVDTGCDPLSRGSYASVGAAWQTTGTDNCSSNVTTTQPQTTGPTHVCCAAK